MAAKRCLEFYDNIARERGGKCLSAEYVNSQTKCEWECAKGHRWLAKANDIQQGKWCRRCAGLDKKSLGWAQNLASRSGGKIISTEFDGVHRKYEWVCDDGHRWFATAASVQQGRWCVKCVGLDKKSLEWLQEQADIHGGTCLSQTYSSNSDKYDWRCSSGHIWSAVANSVQQGHWCPYCARKSSKLELELFRLVKLKFTDAQNRVRGLLTNRLFELDIYVPSLNKAIEFDGEFWHHSEWSTLNGSPARDARKDSECIESGIGLLRVRESRYIANKITVSNEVLQFLQGESSCR
jgi:hypothetical protein